MTMLAIFGPFLTNSTPMHLMAGPKVGLFVLQHPHIWDYILQADAAPQAPDTVTTRQHVAWQVHQQFTVTYLWPQPCLCHGAPERIIVLCRAAVTPLVTGLALLPSSPLPGPSAGRGTAVRGRPLSPLHLPHLRSS
jgi:hypothetical protein